jgi:hypothetical protein
MQRCLAERHSLKNLTQTALRKPNYADVLIQPRNVYINMTMAACFGFIFRHFQVYHIQI